MKKTIVGIMTIVAMLVAILGTNVNAATVSANPTEVKAGDEITVTVTTGEAMKSVQYEIVYNPEYVEPVLSKGVQTANANTLPSKGVVSAGSNKVLVSAMTGPTGEAGNYTAVTFKALKDTDATNFSVEGTEFSVDGMNPVTDPVTNTVDVKIGEGTVTPDPTDTPEPTAEPTAEPTGTTAPTATPNNDKIKYPQTGAPVYAYVAGIALVAIVAGAVLAVRKNK